MDMMVTPLIFVIISISIISFLAMRKFNKAEAMAKGGTEISDAVEEHPFALNPILWIILIASVFIGIVIIYYATSFN